MTLKEKFEEIELGGSNTFLSESDAQECEQIADDYAIEFANWLLNSWCLHSLSCRAITMKLSLEISKK